MLSEALSPYFFKVVKGLMKFRHFLTETILTPGEFSLSQSGVQQTHFTQVVVSGTAFTSRAAI